MYRTRRASANDQRRTFLACIALPLTRSADPGTGPRGYGGNCQKRRFIAPLQGYLSCKAMASTRKPAGMPETPHIHPGRATYGTGLSSYLSHLLTCPFTSISTSSYASSPSFATSTFSSYPTPLQDILLPCFPISSIHSLDNSFHLCCPIDSLLLHKPFIGSFRITLAWASYDPFGPDFIEFAGQCLVHLVLVCKHFCYTHTFRRLDTWTSRCPTHSRPNRFG